jgi:hypothetical protein
MSFVTLFLTKQQTKNMTTPWIAELLVENGEPQVRLAHVGMVLAHRDRHSHVSQSSAKFFQNNKEEQRSSHAL